MASKHTVWLSGKQDEMLISLVYWKTTNKNINRDVAEFVLKVGGTTAGRGNKYECVKWRNKGKMSQWGFKHANDFMQWQETSVLKFPSKWPVIFTPVDGCLVKTQSVY